MLHVQARKMQLFASLVCTLIQQGCMLVSLLALPAPYSFVQTCCGHLLCYALCQDPEVQKLRWARL